ncbi:MAG TPA: hypothetical protein VF624_19160 [Tepidisphaeraceae bacterium]|jgi:hypothetical protein
MNPDDQQLIDDVAALTGEAPPPWAGAEAPTLQSTADESLYLIGVIGGKDVGKSSLINSLLRTAIAGVSATGEGTARGLAYVHEADVDALRRLLDPLIAGRYDVIPHRVPEARYRVLLDLPDIDSIYDGHIELTRRVLRHLLYPIWVQSVEKYADQQPMKMLQQVAAGNAPENFLFVLTKVDQLAARHGEAAVDELRDDYANRLARACELPAPPRVMAVANTDPARFDLPALTELAIGRRAGDVVASSRQLARLRQQRSLVGWLAGQNVSGRLAAAERLLDEAESLVAARLAVPIVDALSSRLATAPGVRAALIEPTVRERLSYWPIVNVIDATLGPVVAAVRGGDRAVAPQQLEGRDLSTRVRGVFAELAQRDPQVIELYARNKLWEQTTADLAAADLSRQVDTAVAGHQVAVRQAAGRPPLPIRLIAPLVTLGAALWFPIVQPALEIVLQNNLTEFTKQTLLLVIKLLGATYLIQSVGFLAIYFMALWMWLRWLAYRRVDRRLRAAADTAHPASAVLVWTQRLLEPIRKHVEKLRSLDKRITDAAGAARAA